MKSAIKIIIIVAIIAGVICAWIFYDGYRLAADMVNNKQLTYLTYRLKLDTLYGLKKRGFIYYCENNTTLNEVIQEINDNVKEVSDAYDNLWDWL